MKKNKHIIKTKTRTIELEESQVQKAMDLIVETLEFNQIPVHIGIYAMTSLIASIITSNGTYEDYQTYINSLQNSLNKELKPQESKKKS